MLKKSYSVDWNNYFFQNNQKKGIGFQSVPVLPLRKNISTAKVDEFTSGEDSTEFEKPLTLPNKYYNDESLSSNDPLNLHVSVSPTIFNAKEIELAAQPALLTKDLSHTNSASPKILAPKPALKSIGNLKESSSNEWLSRSHTSSDTNE